MRNKPFSTIEMTVMASQVKPGDYVQLETGSLEQVKSITNGFAPGTILINYKSGLHTMVKTTENVTVKVRMK